MRRRRIERRREQSHEGRVRRIVGPQAEDAAGQQLVGQAAQARLAVERGEWSMSSSTASTRRAGSPGWKPPGDDASAKKSPCTSVQRASATSAPPSGTRPRRCQSITGAITSTTDSEPSAGCSSAAIAVWPRPRPPTTTSRPSPPSASSPSFASATSAAVNRLDIRNSSPSFTS
jgi:hypothetical protein